MDLEFLNSIIYGRDMVEKGAVNLILIGDRYIGAGYYTGKYNQVREILDFIKNTGLLKYSNANIRPLLACQHAKIPKCNT
jgi:hypothetical protein